MLQGNFGIYERSHSRLTHAKDRLLKVLVDTTRQHVVSPLVHTWEDFTNGSYRFLPLSLIDFQEYESTRVESTLDVNMLRIFGLAF